MAEILFSDYGEYIKRFREDFEQRDKRREVSIDDVQVTLFPGVFPSDSPYTYSTHSIILSVKKDIEHNVVHSDNAYRMLDLCTGSGIIAVYLKSHFKNAEVIASDFDLRALENAAYNFQKQQPDIRLIQSDFFQNIEGRFDIITTSIPFVDDWSAVPPTHTSLSIYWETIGDHITNDGVIYFNWADWADFELAERVAKKNGFEVIDYDSYDLPIGQYEWRTYRFKKRSL